MTELDEQGFYHVTAGGKFSGEGELGEDGGPEDDSEAEVEEWIVVETDGPDSTSATGSPSHPAGCAAPPTNATCPTSDSSRPRRVSIAQFCQNLAPSPTPESEIAESQQRRERYRAEAVRRLRAQADARALPGRTREYIPFWLPAAAVTDADDSPFATFARRSNMRERERADPDVGTRQEFERAGFIRSEIDRLMDISFGAREQDWRWIEREDVIARIERVSEARMAWWIGQMEMEMAEQETLLRMAQDSRCSTTSEQRARAQEGVFGAGSDVPLYNEGDD